MNLMALPGPRLAGEEEPEKAGRARKKLRGVAGDAPGSALSKEGREEEECRTGARLTPDFQQGGTPAIGLVGIGNQDVPESC